MERPFTWVWITCLGIVIVVSLYVFSGIGHRPKLQIPDSNPIFATPTQPALPTPTPRETPLALPELFPDLQWAKSIVATGSGYTLQAPKTSISLNGDLWTAKSAQNTPTKAAALTNKFDDYYSTFLNLTNWSEDTLAVGNSRYSVVYPKSANSLTKGYLKKYKNQLQVIYLYRFQSPPDNCPCTLNFEVFISHPLSATSGETSPAP